MRGPMRDVDSMKIQPMFWTTKETARYLRVSHRTLDKYRYEGGGPPFVKLGRKVVYEIEVVKQWAEELKSENAARNEEVSNAMSRVFGSSADSAEQTLEVIVDIEERLKISYILVAKLEEFESSIHDLRIEARSVIDQLKEERRTILARAADEYRKGLFKEAQEIAGTKGKKAVTVEEM